MQLASPDYLHLGHKWKPPSHAAYDLGDCSRNVALKAAVCEIKPTIFVYFLIFKIIYTFFYARIYLLFFFYNSLMSGLSIEGKRAVGAQFSSMIIHHLQIDGCTILMSKTPIKRSVTLIAIFAKVLIF